MARASELCNDLLMYQVTLQFQKSKERHVVYRLMYVVYFTSTTILPLALLSSMY